MQKRTDCTLFWTATLTVCSAQAGFAQTADGWASTDGRRSLNAENIARSSMAVAEATNSSGYCYKAVARALSPLGVQLSGASAYMARPILLNDKRFVPLSISNVDQLSRGDIIVYQNSSSHKHGHICVYEGNYIEASDHVAKVTHTQAYGGATVFRLRDELIAHSYSGEEKFPPSAPPIETSPASYIAGSYNANLPAIAQAHYSNARPYVSSAITYGSPTQTIKSRIIRTVARRALRFLMDSL